MTFKKNLALLVLAIMVAACLAIGGTALAQKMDVFPKVEIQQGKQGAGSIEPGDNFRPKRDTMKPGTAGGTGSIEPGDNFKPGQQPVVPR